MSETLPTVPPFRMNMFETYDEFEQFLHASDALRGSRWLYERSLASPADALVLAGTCGVCLRPTRFTASTRGGELAPGGRVPNWREGLSCDCTYGLVNRERALLHYLLAQSRAEPWMRALALGEVGALRPILAQLVGSLDCTPGPLQAALGQTAKPPGSYHLVLSIEQLTARLAQAQLLSAIARLLAPGGAFVFTAPFDIARPIDPPASDGPIGWPVLDQLIESGFATARACTYWSEELGYLGPFNVILTAYKG